MLPDKAKFVVCSIIGLALSFFYELHGPSMLPDKAKFVVCSIIGLALSFFDETSSYWSVTKNLLNSRLFIGHHLEVRLSLISFWEPAG